MIRFKNIETSDRAAIQAVTMYGTNRSCDLSIANLVSWQFRFGTQFAIVDDFMLLRFFHGNTLAYLMPAYTSETARDERFSDRLENIVRQLREDAVAMGHPLLLLGADTTLIELVRERFGDFYTITERRNFADYIYLRERLTSLSGKKLQGKRNHINKFKSQYPNYEYRELTQDLIPLCIDLELEWRKRRQSTGEGESMMYELRSMTRALRRWDELGLVGGTLWVENNLVAFTYGCQLTDDTFDVLVEKADANYDGAYQMINREFVERLPEQYTYINREDDMGLEGLRKAKLSYYPEILLSKFAIEEAAVPQELTDEAKIKAETRMLWHETFNDGEAFEELYFSKVYRPEYNCSCVIDGKVVGALQTLPYTMLFHGREVPVSYVSGTAVDKCCRKEGIGRNLMWQAFRKMRNQNTVFSILIPAEEWLYEWYASMGYAAQITCTPPLCDIASTPFETLDRLQRSKDCIVLHDEANWQLLKEDRQLTGSQPLEKPFKGMIRIINATEALVLYARQHPEVEDVLHVVDVEMEQNDAYYRIKNGSVVRTDKPDITARHIPIGELADLIFADEMAEMNAMFNEN